VRFIEAMYADSTLGEDPGAFKFYHLSGPHVPLVLDENIRYVKMDVSRENYRKAATASLKLTALFLDRLRQLGIYDRSLILIVGDHGAGSQGQRFILQPGMPADPGGAVVTMPYMVNALPLLLVKPSGASGDLGTSDSPVSVSDIPATVFSDLGLSVDAPGASLFSIAESARRERRFLNYAGRDIYSYYGDMDEYIVDGPAWMDGSWRHSGRVFKKSRSRSQRRALQPPS
jgi:arylsulfatase A-like enzyme